MTIWPHSMPFTQKLRQWLQVGRFRTPFEKILLFLENVFVMAPLYSHGDTVLTIRMDAIGDFILYLDTAKQYRKYFHDKKIVLIGNSAWSDLARLFPYWDEVWPVDTRAFRTNVIYRWSLLFKVTRSRADTALQPTFSRDIIQGDSIIRASRARERIGVNGDLCNSTAEERKRADSWYTRLLDLGAETISELDRNAKVYSLVTQRPYRANSHEIQLVTTVVDAPEEPYAVLFPGASWEGRRWPKKHFATIADRLFTVYGLTPVLCGASSEFDICSEVGKQMSSPAVNLAGKTDLPDLVTVIQGACLLVSNETSAIHIASAVRTPSVCILGGGHYGRFVPYPDGAQCAPSVAVAPMACFGCNWQCHKAIASCAAVPCVSSITVSNVWQKASALLG